MKPALRIGIVVAALLRGGDACVAGSYRTRRARSDGAQHQPYRGISGHWILVFREGLNAFWFWQPSLPA